MLTEDGRTLYGMCRECLVVCWISGMRKDLVGKEAIDLSGEWVSQGKELELHLLAERSWEGLKMG